MPSSLSSSPSYQVIHHLPSTLFALVQEYAGPKSLFIFRSLSKRIKAKVETKFCLNLLYFQVFGHLPRVLKHDLVPTDPILRLHQDPSSTPCVTYPHKFPTTSGAPAYKGWPAAFLAHNSSKLATEPHICLQASHYPSKISVPLPFSFGTRTFANFADFVLPHFKSVYVGDKNLHKAAERFAVAKAIFTFNSKSSKLAPRHTYELKQARDFYTRGALLQSIRVFALHESQRQLLVRKQSRLKKRKSAIKDKMASLKRKLAEMGELSD